MAKSVMTIKVEFDSVFVDCVKELIGTQNETLESYRRDVEHCKSTFGVDLVELGFCQGEFYKKSAEKIQGLLTAFKNCDTIVK